MNTTRAEHLAWCKERALQYIDTGDIQQGITSMLSDLGKHPETEGHGAIQLTGMMMFSGLLDTTEKARKHIQGFN